MDRAPESLVKTKPARTAISKGTRFEVFKRDGFVCQYCGAHPPATILHVDHIHPVAEGGTNDQDNLITACADCNLGKGAKLLRDVPESLQSKAAEVEEKEAQLAGYLEILEGKRRRIEADVDAVAAVYESWFEGWTLADPARRSVRRFLEHLPVPVLVDAMEVACYRMFDGRSEPPSRVFKYFCGICWKTIRGEQ